jgi:hypothetical protein
MTIKHNPFSYLVLNTALLYFVGCKHNTTTDDNPKTTTMETAQTERLLEEDLNNRKTDFEKKASEDKKKIYA